MRLLIPPGKRLSDSPSFLCVAPSLLTEEIMHDNLARAANLLATQDFEDPVAFYDRREAQLKTEIVKLGGRIDFFLRLHDHAVADLTNVRADRAKEFPAGSSEDTSMPAASGSVCPFHEARPCPYFRID